MTHDCGDPNCPHDPGDREYLVTVTAAQTVGWKQTVTVWAISEDEAIDLADEHYDFSLAECTWGSSIHFDEVSCQLKEPKLKIGDPCPECRGSLDMKGDCMAGCTIGFNRKPKVDD